MLSSHERRSNWINHCWHQTPKYWYYCIIHRANCVLTCRKIMTFSKNSSMYKQCKRSADLGVVVTGEWMLFFVIIWSARRGETHWATSWAGEKGKIKRNESDCVCGRCERKHTTCFMVATKVFGKCSHYALEICTFLNCCNYIIIFLRK